MKKLADAKEVSSRSYYFLLEWNEKDEWVYMIKNFNKASLSMLTLLEYRQLFAHAVKSELEQL